MNYSLSGFQPDRLEFSVKCWHLLAMYSWPIDKIQLILRAVVRISANEAKILGPS